MYFVYSVVFTFGVGYMDLRGRYSEWKQKLTKDDGSNPSTVQVNEAVDRLNEIPGTMQYVFLGMTVLAIGGSVYGCVQETK
jgi:hypothetical protein